MSLYKKLTAARLAADLSQLEVAEALDVSRQAISRWEQGLGSPTADNLKKLSALYHVSVDYLLHDEIEDPMQMVGIPPFKPEAEKNTDQVPPTATSSSEAPPAASKKHILIGMLSLGLTIALVLFLIALRYIGHQDSDPLRFSEISSEQFESNDDWDIFTLT